MTGHQVSTSTDALLPEDPLLGLASGASLTSDLGFSNLNSPSAQSKRLIFEAELLVGR